MKRICWFRFCKPEYLIFDHLLASNEDTLESHVSLRKGHSPPQISMKVQRGREDICMDGDAISMAGDDGRMTVVQNCRAFPQGTKS